MLSYRADDGVSRDTFLAAVSLAPVTQIGTVPLAALLCDDCLRRRLVLLAGCVATVLVAYPFFWLLDTHQPAAIVLALALPVCYWLTDALQASFLPELFPTQLRYSGSGITHTLGGLLFSVPVSFVAAALWDRYDATWLLALYALGRYRAQRRSRRCGAGDAPLTTSGGPSGPDRPTPPRATRSRGCRLGPREPPWVSGTGLHGFQAIAALQIDPKTEKEVEAMATRPGPLTGVRVVDMTTSYAGPTAAMYLADLGATVIKVERTGRGDDTRGWGPPFADGVSAWFASANRNKQSLALNLRAPEGRETLLRLLDTAHVFLQNFNPAKLRRMGIDSETLQARNPRLVYCAMSGFGLDGPDSDLPGYDLVAQARSGLMSVTGEKGRSPQRVSTALSDVVTGMCAALAVNAALVRQFRTGEGEVIDVSLLDSDLALMAPRIASYHAGEADPAPSGGTDSVLAVYQPFETADRTMVVAIGNDAMWQRFVAAVGLPEFAEDPALADNAGRRGRRAEITAAIAARLATCPAAEWLQILGDADVPVALVQAVSEVVKDPQVIARGSLLPVPGSEEQLITIHSPFRLESVGEPRNERFPELGADTRSVLGGIGYSDADIDELVAAGVIELGPGAVAS
ncbi:CoA transferase [Streptomyces sp. NPDC001027]|uniref:CoA transferase n=1 Tax=Streptomyces sp. NPDC001027 TaxID=3154771 RepID=UPI0033170362